MSNISSNISDDEIINFFFNKMGDAGIKPRERFTPNMDGKTHRFAVEGDNRHERSGAYFCHSDYRGVSFGVMDFHQHGEMQKFSINPKRDFTPEERREYLKQNNISGSNTSGIRGLSQTRQSTHQSHQTKTDHEELKRQEAEKAERQRKAQEQAMKTAFAEYMNGSDDWQQHPYYRGRFTGKGFTFLYHGQFDTAYLNRGTTANPDYDYSRIIRYTPKLCIRTLEGGICRKGGLLLPMVNVETWNFQSLILIPEKPDGNGKFQKFNYTGTSITGSAFMFLPDTFIMRKTPTHIFVCEGFCTALAVMIDTDGVYPVFSCGTCHNLKPVCSVLRTRYKDSKIIIIADNDKNGVGEKAARDCIALGVANGFRMPATAGYDWYDEICSRNRTPDERRTTR